MNEICRNSELSPLHVTALIYRIRYKSFSKRFFLFPGKPVGFPVSREQEPDRFPGG